MNSHVFTSDLSVAEHHAIRTVGFSPVGQVMGACVYRIDYTSPWNCGHTGPDLSFLPLGPRVAPRVRDVAELREARYEALRRAVDRMRQECVRLNGDGVVAVRLAIEPFPAGGLEFRVIGTAVRASGDVRPRQPFLSDLSGQDFARLIFAGWVPCGLVIGVAAMVRHDDARTRSQTLSWRNLEMDGHTELVETTRASARNRSRDECVRCGGAGVVLRTMTLDVRKRSCRTVQGESEDHLAEAMAIGTAITPFRHTGGSSPQDPLPILRLR